MKVAWKLSGLDAGIRERLLKPIEHGTRQSEPSALDEFRHLPARNHAWRYALQQGAAIITKDEDFPHRLRQRTAAPVIVWLRMGNASRKALLQSFQPLIPQIIALIEQGDRLFEVR